MNTNESGPRSVRDPWNKGKVVGQKAPLKLRDVWAIRVHLQMEQRVRELALFNLALDSKLRGCDLVAVRVRDVCHGEAVASRTSVVQQKTGHPVQFEITATTREALASWIKAEALRGDVRGTGTSGRPILLRAGQMAVVPKGIEHRPRAHGEVKLLLIEPRGVLNTGNGATNERTALNDLWI